MPSCQANFGAIIPLVKLATFKPFSALTLAAKALTEAFRPLITLVACVPFAVTLNCIPIGVVMLVHPHQ
jgi:hypothetical protein